MCWPPKSPAGGRKAAGDAIGADLLNNPDLGATDAYIAWKTGVWYWMTGYGPVATATGCHEAMMASSGSGGFGSTIMHINGAQECSAKGGANTAGRDERSRRYEMFCDMLGVSYGNNLSCRPLSGRPAFGAWRPRVRPS